MSAIATITLTNSASAAVNFDPVGISPEGIAHYEDRSGGIAVGYKKLSLNLRRPSKTSRNYRMTTKMVLPVLEQTSPSTATGIQPAPTAAYSLLFNLESVMPDRCTTTDRADALAFIRSVVWTTEFENMFVNQEGLW